MAQSPGDNPITTPSKKIRNRSSPIQSLSPESIVEVPSDDPSTMAKQKRKIPTLNKVSSASVVSQNPTQSPTDNNTVQPGI